MAISKKRKEELVQEYAGYLAQSRGLILTDYRGLRVFEMERFRRSLRDADAVVSVVKNRLLQRVLAEKGLTLPGDWLEGTTAVAFCRGEVPPVAKAILAFAKDSPTLTIKGGIVESSAISGEQVKALAELPSREVLLAQVLGTINAPATQVAGVVATGIRQVLNLLQAYVDKMEGKAAPQAA